MLRNVLLTRKTLAKAWAGLLLCGLLGSPWVASVAVAVGEANEAAEGERGLQIFTEMDQRTSGFGDFEVGLTMTLRASNGNVTERAMRIRQFEESDDGDKILVVFDAPANIRGTALLSHGHLEGADDQWLFLPALNRVKRISSRNRSGSFLGSEFAFEDFSSQELGKYSYRFVREENLGEMPCYVVERVAVDGYSGYSREVFWIDQAEYRTQRVEYFDRKDRPLKVLQVSEYGRYDNGQWRAHHMHMQNLRTEKVTELSWQDYRFLLGFNAERDFSVNSLRRAR